MKEKIIDLNDCETFDIIDLNRKDLRPQAKNKKIEEIQLEDFKLTMRKIAEAEIIEFTCHLESKIKLLKHRWSIFDNVGRIRDKCF